MDFIDKLLPIIVLIIWALLTFSNKKKKRGNAQKPPQSGKKTNPAFSFFENIQKSVENILTENQVSIPLPKTSFSTNTDVKPKAVAITSIEAKTIENNKSSQTVVSKKKAAQSKRDSYEPTMKPESEREEYPNYKNISTKRALSVKRLREAIIWSEILARPISLRDDSSDIF